MKIQSQTFRVGILVLVIATGQQVLAQDGKLKIHTSPKRAYIFIDGHAMGEASKHHSLSLDAGDHKIEVVNYGYSPVTNTVTITAGETSNLEVTLPPVGATVSGPFGAMTIEGADRDAVLLNGKTPDFFVGHGDEFNHNWGWKQELVVPPGTYQVSILGADKEVWSGPVDVPANQRVVVDIPNGVRKTIAWSRGEKLSAVPRFTVGAASATVAVAKPTAELSATAAQINCGDSSQLKWNSSDAPQVELTPVGSVAASGDQSVQPKQNTTYQLTAVGPGGTVTSSATVNVNTAVQVDLGLSPAEVHYRRVGDQVVQQDHTALNWSTSNASAVSISPLGSVDATGNRTVDATPQKTDPGPVDENVTYTLTATNVCGGTETKTATLHLVGVIEQPTSGLALNSVYFPTDLPTANNLQAGLLASQQATLKFVADAFKEYLGKQPDAHLSLVGHADKRGPESYNQSLSERRVEAAKDFLVAQEVPADHLDTQAEGEQQNLSTDQVEQLVQQNSQLSEEERQAALKKIQTLVFASNRRVDIVLSTTGQTSANNYPFKAEDYSALVDRNQPGKESPVEAAATKEKVTN
jgi:outer membrane protein OmpA-like peptidoglycan-associated protein